jgi:DNA polymerase-3 subunit epsilon
MIQVMKQLSGKIGSNIYASVQDPSNPHLQSFLRQIEKEINSTDELDTPLKQLSVVVFDLETTGFYPEKGDEILSIGAVKVKGNEIENETFYSLVSTNRSLPLELIHLTGITQEKLEFAPKIEEVLTNFYQFINKNVLVAHHSKHESSFMKYVCKNVNRRQFNHRIVDTSFLIKLIDPTIKNMTLEDCCSHCEILVKDRHHALGDARMTAQLWVHYLNKVQSQGFRTLREIYEEVAKIG